MVQFRALMGPRRRRGRYMATQHGQKPIGTLHPLSQSTYLICIYLFNFKVLYRGLPKPILIHQVPNIPDTLRVHFDNTAKYSWKFWPLFCLATASFWLNSALASFVWVCEQTEVKLNVSMGKTGEKGVWFFLIHVRCGSATYEMIYKKINKIFIRGQTSFTSSLNNIFTWPSYTNAECSAFFYRPRCYWSVGSIIQSKYLWSLANHSF